MKKRDRERMLSGQENRRRASNQLAAAKTASFCPIECDEFPPV